MAFPDSTWARAYGANDYLSRLHEDTGRVVFVWEIGSFLKECQPMQERKHFRSKNFGFAGATWNLFFSFDRERLYSRFGINIRGCSSSDMFFKCISKTDFHTYGKIIKFIDCNFECRGADSYGLVDNFFSNLELNEFLSQGRLINCEIKVLKCSSGAVEALTLTESSENKVCEVCQDFRNLLFSEEGSDVTLQVRDQQFKVHQLILKTRSSVFAAMFQHDTKEKATGVVDVKDCDPSSFPVFLEFLYCGSVEKLSAENVFSLYTCADKYDVQSLKRKCFQFIKLNLSVDTFCETVRLSLQHSEADLLKRAVDFFAINFKKIVSNPKWQAFNLENPDQVNEIFSKAFPSDTGDGRGGYQCNGSGEGSSYSGEEIQDTVFISGLPEDVNEDELSNHFGAIGVIKMDKRTGKRRIWIYKDKITGRGKGEATVTYDDPPTASCAINWFGGKDFRGKKINVQLAQRKTQSFGDGPGCAGPMRGGSGGDRRSRPY